MKKLESQEDGSRSEERLVALYMELTGASLNEARGVYAHLAVTNSGEPSVSRADAGPVKPVTQRQRAALKVTSTEDDENGLPRGTELLFPGTESVLSYAGGGR